MSSRQSSEPRAASAHIASTHVPPQQAEESRLFANRVRAAMAGMSDRRDSVRALNRQRAGQHKRRLIDFLNSL